ncbi:VOC family protein [Candidatus Accumulibacter vicinus]|uniref:3-demethylubiquinone-9 3-methyltransferase n=1 Tax=Candidatus Accumulibacter vicinus TaxID=2954382 RepID=A0A084Y0G4_9PROT|nr:VOC family protein [Candidatus Accumulibacter vicinus]KFB68208.1 MAG: 3-demethylubiquinone-9 3-methyltransferase [Candidatus Accumulibacter vicinus]
MPIQPYLFFDGRCEEAIGFYRQALGAELEMLMHYREAPEKCPGMLEGYDDKVMHSCLRVGEATLMMADDCIGHPNFQGFSLSLQAANEAEARRRFDALVAGGKVVMPLGKTFFSPCFGMVADRFGVSWMVIVPEPEASATR